MLEKTSINIIGRIDEKLLRNFLFEYEKKNHAQNIFLYIDSQGGFTETTMEIAKYILSCEGVITTMAGKKVFSSALVLHQIAPLERIAYSDSKFLLHRQFKENPSLTISEEERERERMFFRLFAMNTGKTIDEIYNHADRGLVLNAYEAKTFGFVTDIISSPAPENGRGILFFPKKSV